MISLGEDLAQIDPPWLSYIRINFTLA